MLTLAPKTNIVERFYFPDVLAYIVMTITTTNNALDNMLGLYPPITGTGVSSYYWNWYSSSTLELIQYSLLEYQRKDVTLYN